MLRLLSYFYYLPFFVSEISPPQVKTCPHNIQRSTNTVLTRVEEPDVEFITSKGLKAPHVCEPFGENKVHNFTVGVHMVKCVAHDPLFGLDTTSTCIFSIYIKGRFRSLIFYDHLPLNKDQ